jgi:5-formyltetrahydrofolate cyclo-ligase
VTKEEIRQRVLRLRESQSSSWKNKKDAKILNRLLRMRVFAGAREFFTYLSHRGEVSTDGLLKKYFGKKKIIVPKLKSRGMCLYELHDPHQFTKGKFGIREPTVCLTKKAWHEIDVALIPGVAFDMTGHRIGFGGGHFDRFLKKLDCTTIGLAYELQIIDKVPTHQYDMPVDFIITEKRTIQCQPFKSKTPKSQKSSKRK